VITTVWAVARRPRLWSTAVRQVCRTVDPRWWRRPPFVPRPPKGFLRFRMQTHYGDADHDMESADVLNYLSWCREWDRA